MSATTVSNMTSRAALHTPSIHLCQRGSQLFAAWLKAEPRLIAILPEILGLPAQLLVAGSAAGDLYLTHIRECAECSTLAEHN